MFEFYAHVTPDNDRYEMLDRQRVEIKTYEPSSDTGDVHIGFRCVSDIKKLINKTLIITR